LDALNRALPESQFVTNSTAASAEAAGLAGIAGVGMGIVAHDVHRERDY